VGVLAFSGAADMIQERWVGLLSGIALSTSEVADAISADIRGVVSDAEDVSRTMANLDRSKIELKKGDMPDVLVRPGETLDTATLRAIHAPDWYYKHYAQRFESLISAVKSLRSTGTRANPSGGRTAGSRSKQAADRVPQHFPQLAGGGR